MEIVWTGLAVDSLSNIVQYVQSWFGVETASDVSTKILAFVDSLSISPYIGKRIKNLSQYGDVRCIIYRQNQIYYRLSENQVEIILVWDGRQDPNRLRMTLLNFFVHTPSNSY